MTRTGSKIIPVQAGALPWRQRQGKKNGKVEILLITGRRSGRWMIPKGWRMLGKSVAESAAQEAFEEAGVEGTIEREPLGRFRHVKQHILFGKVEVDIQVHVLSVERELDDWPERGERLRKWFKLEEAPTKVDSDELRDLIRRFGNWLRA